MEKYTVIIPTRDRAETLKATIHTCLRQTYKNFEIIVSDNCSVDDTKKIVLEFKDSRIKYINPGQRLSMSGNFEFALGHVAEGFVMFIGSDDGIMPGAIDYVNFIVEKFNVDAVSCAQATYVWPDFIDQSIAGRLTLGGGRNDVEIRNASEWIHRTLNFESMYCFGLPSLYCGFVKKSIINKAYKDGTYFKSITPDAYSAFATAIFIDKFAYSYRPFVIAGASSKSNGASALHPKGDKKESNKFHSENNIKFCDGFINCPSFEVICAETFAQLKKLFPDLCFNYEINYKKMLINALRNTNEKTKEDVLIAVELMRLNFSDILDKQQNYVRFKKYNFIGRLFSLIKLLSNYSQIIEIRNSHLYGVMDVNDAALVADILMQNKSNQNFISKGAYLKARLSNIFMI